MFYVFCSIKICNLPTKNLQNYKFSCTIQAKYLHFYRFSCIVQANSVGLCKYFCTLTKEFQKSYRNVFALVQIICTYIAGLFCYKFSPTSTDKDLQLCRFPSAPLTKISNSVEPVKIWTSYHTPGKIWES